MTSGHSNRNFIFREEKMKNIIILLCLALIGCAATDNQIKNFPQALSKPAIAEEMDMDSIIAVFTEVIDKNPDYPGYYYNRALAYYYKKDYDKCWQDVNKVELLGVKFSNNFIESLKKATNRKK